MSEPGNPVAFILFHKATPGGGETYPIDQTVGARIGTKHRSYRQMITDVHADRYFGRYRGRTM
jgi:hypothetical protein